MRVCVEQCTSSGWYKEYVTKDEYNKVNNEITQITNKVNESGFSSKIDDEIIELTKAIKKIFAKHLFQITLNRAHGYKFFSGDPKVKLDAFLSTYKNSDKTDDQLFEIISNLCDHKLKYLHSEASTNAIKELFLQSVGKRGRNLLAVYSIFKQKKIKMPNVVHLVLDFLGVDNPKLPGLPPHLAQKKQ